MLWFVKILERNTEDVRNGRLRSGTLQGEARIQYTTHLYVGSWRWRHPSNPTVLPTMVAVFHDCVLYVCRASRVLCFMESLQAGSRASVIDASCTNIAVAVLLLEVGAS